MKKRTKKKRKKRKKIKLKEILVPKKRSHSWVIVPNSLPLTPETRMVFLGASGSCKRCRGRQEAQQSARSRDGCPRPHPAGTQALLPVYFLFSPSTSTYICLQSTGGRTRFEERFKEDNSGGARWRLAQEELISH